MSTDSFMIINISVLLFVLVITIITASIIIITLLI